MNRLVNAPRLGMGRYELHYTPDAEALLSAATKGPWWWPFVRRKKLHALIVAAFASFKEQYQAQGNALDTTSENDHRVRVKWETVGKAFEYVVFQPVSDSELSDAVLTFEYTGSDRQALLELLQRIIRGRTEAAYDMALAFREWRGDDWRGENSNSIDMHHAIKAGHIKEPSILR